LPLLPLLENLQRLCLGLRCSHEAESALLEYYIRRIGQGELDTDEGELRRECERRKAFLCPNRENSNDMLNDSTIPKFEDSSVSVGKQSVHMLFNEVVMQQYSWKISRQLSGRDRAVTR